LASSQLPRCEWRQKPTKTGESDELGSVGRKMETVLWQSQGKWGKLTDDDLEVVRGRRDQLIGKIQERYGIVRTEAEKQVDEFARSFRSEESTQEVPQANREGTAPSTPNEKKRGAGQS
jgi:uncharacterized protein YjbJ (UPF0337 family)